MARPVGKSWSTDLTWSNLDDQARTGLIDQISPVDGKYQLESSTSISATNLSFYPTHHVTRLLDLEIRKIQSIQLNTIIPIFTHDV